VSTFKQEKGKWKMGKMKKIEISEEVIEFYQSQTAGMSKDEVEDFVYKVEAGEVDFSHNKRIKRCLQCDHWFEDSRANKRKCCSKTCKTRYDSANRKSKRQQATADRQGITVEQLHDKRAQGRFEVIPIGDGSKLDYFVHDNNSGNRKKFTSEVDESGEGKPNVYVNYGKRKADRDAGEVVTQKLSPKEVDAYLGDKYGEYRLEMERKRAVGFSK
jgi:hypothetical protein